MSEQENKLIAEFMGIQVIDNEIDSPFRPNLNCFRKKELKYHSDWNWLIPVIEKIETLNNPTTPYNSSVSVNIYDNACEISYTGYHSGTIVEINLGNKLKSTYEAVLKFIEWYNKQIN